MPKPVASIWANGAQVDANHPAVAEAERLGAVIGRENPGRALIPNEYWYRIGGNADGQYDPQQFARPFKPTNQQEFDRMPPGTEYHDRQNKLQKKPGAPAPVAQDMVNRKPAAQPAAPVAQDMVNRKPGAPAEYQQFREPGSGRTPALLKEMQAGGMMPKDMQLSRFMTMPSPDYLGTLNENTAPKTGTPVMAKNRPPTASPDQPVQSRDPLADQIMAELARRAQQSRDPLDPSLFQVRDIPRPRGSLSRAMADDPGQQMDPYRHVPRSRSYQNPVPDLSPSDDMGVPFGGVDREAQIRQQFAGIDQKHQAALQAERAAKEAEWERVRTQGGYFPGGNGYSSLKPGSWNAGAQAEVDNFAANNPRPSPTTLNRLPGEVPPSMRPSPAARATSQYMPGQQSSGGSSYVPGGIDQRAPDGSQLTHGAIRTGDPFFDVNIDFDRLKKEKLLKDHNDAAFTDANDTRMSEIAQDRRNAESTRRSDLYMQGKTPEEVVRIMYPQRFAQPKDPAIAQAQAIDAAERQGRSNLHAIAQKFRRNGIPMDQAYAAAMNTIKTTNPADKGAVPSLPGMDPLRVIGSVGGQAGASAGAYGVGLANAQNALTLGNQTSADNRYGVDSRERVGLAQAQNNFIQGLLQNAQKEAELRMNQGVVNSETSAAEQARNLEMIKLMQGQGVHNLPPGHPDRALYDRLWQGMMNPPAAGGGGGAPAPGVGGGGGAPDAMRDWLKWMGGGPGSPPPAAPAAAPAPAPPMNAAQHYASNPATMQQYLNQFADPKERQRQEALMYSQGGVQHPSVDKYLNDWMTENQPNLAPWWPDAPWLNDNGTLAQRAAEEAAAATGIPQATALQTYRRYYGLPSQ